MRTEASQGQASGELWSMDLASRRRQRLFPELLMAHYSLSQDGRRVIFTTAGHEGGDGIWIADLDRRTPARQLTTSGEPRAFFGDPGEIVYLGDDGRLRRMRDDGSDAAVVSPDSLVHLMTVSPDGRWAAVIAPTSTEGGGTRVEFRSLRGEAPITVCEDACRGIGPASVRFNLPFSWSLDGTRLIVNLLFFDRGPEQAVVLPYRSGASFDSLWPAGLRTAKDVQANPGAQVINSRGVFASADRRGPTWKPSFQSNMYRIRLPSSPAQSDSAYQEYPPSASAEPLPVPKAVERVGDDEAIHELGALVIKLSRHAAGDRANHDSATLTQAVGNYKKSEGSVPSRDAQWAALGGQT